MANVWRSSRLPVKIYRTACDMWDATTADMYFVKVPGRAMKARWGSIHFVETIVVKGKRYIGNFFSKLIDPKVRAKAKADKQKAVAAARQVRPRDAKKDQYHDGQRRYKRRAVDCTTDPSWLISVEISLTIKQPIKPCLLWMQKTIGKDNAEICRNQKSNTCRACIFRRNCVVALCYR